MHDGGGAPLLMGIGAPPPRTVSMHPAHNGSGIFIPDTRKVGSHEPAGASIYIPYCMFPDAAELAAATVGRKTADTYVGEQDSHLSPLAPGKQTKTAGSQRIDQKHRTTCRHTPDTDRGAQQGLIYNPHHMSPVAEELEATTSARSLPVA